MRSLLFPSILVLLTAWSPGEELETVTPRQGEIREFFEEPARTRLAVDKLGSLVTQEKKSFTIDGHVQAVSCRFHAALLKILGNR